jgi:hypothetical protein
MTDLSFSYDKAIALLLDLEKLLSKASGTLRQVRAPGVTSTTVTRHEEVLEDSDTGKLLTDAVQVGQRIDHVVSELQELNIPAEMRPDFLEFHHSIENVHKVAREASYSQKVVEDLRSLRHHIDDMVGGLEKQTARGIVNLAASARRSVDMLLMSTAESLRSTATTELSKISGRSVNPTRELLNRLIGERLEKQILPGLLRELDFELQPTIISTKQGQLEVDARGEKVTCTGIAAERLTAKKVIVVECKTTVHLRDIEEFAKKVAVLKSKYEAEKAVWNYEAYEIEAWLVACYGWTEGLKAKAKASGIEPVDDEALRRRLSECHLEDHRIPVCPRIEGLTPA